MTICFSAQVTRVLELLLHFSSRCHKLENKNGSKGFDHSEKNFSRLNYSGLHPRTYQSMLISLLINRRNLLHPRLS